MTVLSSNAYEIANKRYFMTEDEGWDKLSIRCGGETARVETQKVDLYRDKFAEMIYNMDFIPAGRILRNLGRLRGSVFNCYVLPLLDSIEEIGQFIKECLVVWSEGGGIGVNASFLRPEGTLIKGKGGHSSGPISFLKAADSAASTIESGGQRRAAGLALMLCTHPDIMKFIDAKSVDGILSYFNISVGITEEYIDAIERDDMWTLSFNHQPHSEIKARDIWNKIIHNMINYAEPGLLNWDKLRSNNSYYFAPISASNPCIIGDTLIATADGRNAVSIKQLTEEGKDVPVYSCNPKTGKVEIKYGRNPRKTGIKKEVWKLKLDDGSELIATPDHKILTKNLEYKNLKDLLINESLLPFNSYLVNKGYRNIRNSGKGYRNIRNSGAKMNFGHRSRRQYRLIYEFHNGTNYLGKKLAIHHKDFDNQHDEINNLKLMTFKDHTILHSEKMKGKNNPYHKMTDEWKKNFATHLGETNGRWGGYSNEELIDFGKELYIKFGKFTRNIWYSFTKENKISHKIEAKSRFGSWSTFESLVIDNHKVVSVEFYGYEDVYNITVDDNHNYNIITSNEDNKYIISSGICVKNCGEACLEPYGICDLGSLVLPKYVSNVNTNWKKMEEVIRLAVRFLDNIIEVNKYILPEFDKAAHDARRVGVGVMGLSEYLFMKKIRYGSKKSIIEIERLMKFIRDVSYDESIKLATEKGAFTNFDPIQFGKAHFIRSLPASTRMSIKKCGIRNVTLMAMAPTGTISLLPEVTSGIEPLFSKAYRRSDRVSERIYIHDTYKNIIESSEEIPDWYVDSYDLKPIDHLDVQAAVQKYTDGAVSKTINMPKGTTEDELSELLLEHIHDLKGCTVYVDGCRGGQPLNKMTDEEVRAKLDDAEETPDELSVQCASGKCEI